MFRKLAFAIAASAALGAAALAPTAASAFGGGHFGGGHGFHGGHGGHHGWGRGFGFGFSPVVVSDSYAEDDGCYAQRRVSTRYGYRWRTVNVCD